MTMRSPRLDLKHVASFVALVDSGSFHAAARSLGLSQSAVSQHIKRLEAQLSATLIHRAPGGCAPTEIAQRFLPLAHSLLRLERRAPEIAFEAGPLQLGACSNIGVYVLPDLLAAFVDEGGAMPALTIAPNPDIATKLENVEIDIALMEWWDGRSGFDDRPWGSAPLVAIAAPDHPWSARAAITPDDLAGAAMIGGEPGTGTGRLLREHLGGIRLPKPVLELGSTEAVKQAVMAGLGVSIVLAPSVIEEVRRGGLVARPMDPPLRKPLHLIRRTALSANLPLISFLQRHAATN